MSRRLSEEPPSRREGEQLVQSPTASSDFSPYVLFRRGTIPVSALDGLVPADTWALLGAVTEIEDRLQSAGVVLEEQLHGLAGAAQGNEKSLLIALRRAVHNRRAPGAGHGAVSLPAAVAATLAGWDADRQRRSELLQAAEALLRDELAKGRETLAAVASLDTFRDGVQLSSDALFRDVQAFAMDPSGAGRKPSKRRRVENTITSYAYRIALKPSPFASFTEIGAHAWVAPQGAGANGERRRLARLNIGLLAWLAHRLGSVDCADQLLRVRLNNSLTVCGDQVVFVRRGLEGTDDMFGADRVVVARNTPLISLLQEALAGGSVTVRQLRDRLVGAGMQPERADATIDQLVRLGLCHRGFGLPDQTTGGAGAIARFLRDHGGAQFAQHAAIFEGLQRIEQDFAAAHAEERLDLSRELRAAVHQFADLVGTRPPNDELMSAALYEDVGTSDPARSWKPAVLEDNRENLELFQRLLPVLDEATVERLGLYRFFVRLYGEQSAPVDLIDFYRQFADLSAGEASRLMLGLDDPAAAQVQDLRQNLIRLIERQLDAVPDAGELQLDRHILRQFADALPAWLTPWTSAAYRVQMDSEGESPRAIINGVTTGHGVFFSRFCDLLEPTGGDAWSLRKELRAHIAGRHPRQTDITATLGLNFNLHPRLSPLELVYPGSVAEAGGTTLTLRDVAVQAEPSARRLRLVSKLDGQSLDLVPLNFLYPAAAPPLYRFLCAFAPTRTYRGGLWEQLDRGRPSPPFRPRVLLGDLVLDRRSWRVPVAHLPNLEGLERQEAEALLHFDRWRSSSGLPRRGFFRLTGPPIDAREDIDWVEQTRRWAVEARTARLHKPHFIDTHNPFLAQILAKQARSAPGSTVVWQECSPSLANYVPDHGPGAAEEFFIELNLNATATSDGLTAPDASSAAPASSAAAVTAAQLPTRSLAR